MFVSGLLLDFIPFIREINLYCIICFNLYINRDIWNIYESESALFSVRTN